jgi:hypothetical protein
MRSEREKMLAGKFYYAGDAELQADAAKAKRWMARYNASMAASADERRQLLRELLAAVGDGAVARPPFFCDFGYKHPSGAGRLPELQLSDPRRRAGDDRLRDRDRHAPCRYTRPTIPATRQHVEPAPSSGAP